VTASALEKAQSFLHYKKTGNFIRPVKIGLEAPESTEWICLV
jgi:hypothetical protein